MNFVEYELKFDRRDMQIDWKYADYGSCLWKYKAFYKTVDLQIWIHFSKDFDS